MPTTEELYQRLIAPTLAEDKAKEHFRKRRHEDKMAHKDSLVTEPEPDCLKNGHWPVKHTVTSAPNGKRYAKCGRCRAPFLLSSV